ncbi:MAG: DUF2867 domain-containing protein [Curvibacter sp.]|nr:MAG: DUF2867 domain-containing protein [Curvibacter sp.]
MKARPYACPVPADSLITSFLPGASFHDANAIVVAEGHLSALDHFLQALRHTPRWVDVLMVLRNRVVSLLGLKDLGALSRLDPAKPASAYAVGERVGIFTLIRNTPDEVLLGDQDKHLDVTLSVHRAAATAGGPATVTVTTVVHVHNLLGRIYMLPVTPMHRIIGPSVLKAIGKPAAA